MSLIKDLLSEMGGGAAGGGAVGSTNAGAIAGARGALFGGANTSKRRKKTNSGNVITRESISKKVSFLKRLTSEGNLYSGGIVSFERIKSQQLTALKRAMSYVAEDITGSTDFDVSDVVSKLEAGEKKSKVEKDTTTFGLENENGGIVRVYVRKDQADEFEQALSQMLAGQDNNNDDENTSMEIAEVLFKLKDKYDIVDVDWGDIPEDEEQQEQQVVGGAAGGQPPAGGAAPDAGGAGGGGAAGGQPPAGGESPVDDANAEAGGEEGLEGEGEGEEGGDMTAGGDEGDAKSALDSVIDMMKADAKAKMAEANARAAEARAKEAEWTAKASASKVKQEEEVLDMETHEKEQRDMDKEAKRLAKLAKYRHEKAAKYSDEMGGHDDSSSDESEEEEQGGNRFPYDPKNHYGNNPRKVNLAQLRDMIYAHLRSANK